MRSHKVNFDRSGTEVTVHQKDFAATEISTMSEFSLVLCSRISEVKDDVPR